MKLSRTIPAVLGILLVFTLWYFYFRAAAPSILPPRISWHGGGARQFCAIVHVTRHGQPVPGYPVAFGGFSGEAEQRTITDSTGSATFGVNQSYQEVCVLYLDGRRVVLRPVPLGHYFCPCADNMGITFDVRL